MKCKIKYIGQLESNISNDDVIKCIEHQIKIYYPLIYKNWVTKIKRDPTRQIIVYVGDNIIKGILVFKPKENKICSLFKIINEKYIIRELLQKCESVYKDRSLWIEIPDELVLKYYNVLKYNKFYRVYTIDFKKGISVFFKPV